RWPEGLLREASVALEDELERLPQIRTRLSHRAALGVDSRDLRNSRDYPLAAPLVQRREFGFRARSDRLRSFRHRDEYRDERSLESSYPLARRSRLSTAPSSPVSTAAPSRKAITSCAMGERRAPGTRTPTRLSGSASAPVSQPARRSAQRPAGTSRARPPRTARRRRGRRSLSGLRSMRKPAVPSPVTRPRATSVQRASSAAAGRRPVARAMSARKE